MRWRLLPISLSLAALVLRTFALAAPPATDPTVDWLLTQASTAPASQPADAAAPPATQPLRAFSDNGRPGTIVLSDGTTISGRISTTPGKPLRLLDAADQQYQDLPLSLIRSIGASVAWERYEPEWRFAASGSDAKVYTGRTYPARLTNYRVTLTNGQFLDGAIAAPLTITTPTGAQTYILHKRDKGEPGQRLNQLVFVKRVTFEP